MSLKKPVNVFEIAGFFYIGYSSCVSGKERFTLCSQFVTLWGVVGWCDGAGLTSSAGASY